MWRFRIALSTLLTAAAVLTLSAGPPARADSPPQTPQTPPVFRGAADLVRLDVSVLDRARQPLRGLSASDFRVIEDGKPQEVVALSEVTMPVGAAARPVWARAITPDVVSNELGDQRLFAIVIDGIGDLRASMKRMTLQRPMGSEVARGLREIVGAIINRLGPSDVAAIAGGTCFQSFTNDRDALDRAVDAIRPEGPPCATRFTNADLGPAHVLVHDIAQYLAAAPQRRKIVIYIGPGIDLEGGSWSSGGDDLFAAVKSAQGGNVNIYTINTFGLDAHAESDRERMSRLGGLRDLAAGTGGLAILDLAQYIKGLDQLFRENSSYYVLGYRSAQPDNARRELTVKVAGHEGVLVRARSSMTRSSPTSADGSAMAARPSKGLAAHLAGLIPDIDVAFSADVLPYAVPGAAKQNVAIVTEIAEPVSPGMPRVAQRMDVRIVAYDERGSIAGSAVERATIDMAPSIDSQVRYRILTRFALAPGVYKLRLVAQNAATGKLGNLEFETTVPDFATQAISLSGVAIVTPRQAGPPIPSFGTLAPILDVVPTASRTFAPNTVLDASMRVYQGGTSPVGPVTMSATILDTEGAVIAEVREELAADRFDAHRSAEYHLELPLGAYELRPGAYLLTFQATLGTRHAPRRDVRFVVR